MINEFVGYILEVFNFGLEIINIILNILESVFSFLTNLTLNSDFLSDAITFESILIGVAIPISLQVATWTADKYKDHEIAKFFIEEKLYRWQYFLLLTNIVLAIFLKFLNISNPVALWIIFVWLIVNIFIFYKFIKLVEQYATNTDKLVLNKLKKNVENILKK